MRACWLKWVGRDWSISADYIWLNYSGANTAISFHFYSVVIAKRSQIYKIIPSIFRKPFYEISEIAKRVIALTSESDPIALRLKDFCCQVHLPDNHVEHNRRDNAFQAPR